MSAEDFLRRVELTGLVSEPLMDELRKRVADSDRALRPEMLAKLLVDREELTAGQARKIIGQMMDGSSVPLQAPSKESDTTNDESADVAEPVVPKAPTADPPDDDNSLTLVSENDDLDFAREEEDAPVTLSAKDVLGTSDAGPSLTAGDDNLDGDDILGDLGATPPPVPKPSPPKVSDSSDNYNLEPVEEEEEEVAEAILLDDDDDGIEVIDDGRAAVATQIDTPASGLDDVLSDPMIGESNVVIRRRKSFWGIFDGLLPKRGPRKNRWDSPLILLGGGALVLLIASAVGFLALFRGETADQLFSAGQDAYENQSYAQAITTFNRFTNRFAENPKVSLARVRVDMSKIRQITDISNPDWEAALTQASTSLPTIKAEESFGDARSELAKLLPDITAGLVEQSRQADSTDEKQRTLDLAQQSMLMVNNSEYLPTSVRKPQDIRIEEIETSIQLVKRTIERERALAASVASITTAATEGNITEAYRLRDELIDQFPILTDNATLRDTLGNVTAKERDAVQVTQPDIAAVTTDHASDVRLSIALSDRRGEAIEGVDGHIVGVLVRGAVYGVRASDGEVAWRRYVGYESNAFPVPVSEEVGSDILIVDAAHSELQRVKAATGELVWRLPCQSPISTPIVSGTQAYISCGRDSESTLLSVDLTSTDSAKVMAAAKFPVGCSLAPSLLEARNEIIQVGNHSSVYVLDAATLKCKSVFSPGHARGSVAVPAFAVSSSVMLAENNGRDSAKLHTFGPIGESNDWRRVGPPLKINGQVTSSPSVDDRRAMLVSELGELQILEVPIDSQQPKSLAVSAAINQNLGPSYGLLDRSRIWVANRTLSRYQLQSTRGQVITSWSRDREDRFLNPLRRIGEYLFHVRRRIGMQGATVTATPIEGNGQPAWQTDLGVPSNVVVGAGKVHAVTANGAMFSVQNARVLRKPAARIDESLLPQSFAQTIALSKDNSIFVGPPPSSHFVIAKSASSELQRVPLRIDPDKASAPLAIFANSLLAATEAGPIHLLDASNGQARVTPFTPRLEAGKQIDWLTPASIGRQFVAADTSGHLYRVAANRQQLSLAGESTIDGNIVAGLAASGQLVYAVVLSGGAHEVVAIDGQNLEIIQRWPLDGGVALGPTQVGSTVIVADSAHNVFAFDSTGNRKFQIAGVGPLAGEPLLLNGDMVLTSTDGRITVVGPNGQTKASRQFNEPFGSGAVLFKQRLLVAGWDGTLYLVDVPQ